MSNIYCICICSQTHNRHFHMDKRKERNISCGRRRGRFRRANANRHKRAYKEETSKLVPLPLHSHKFPLNALQGFEDYGLLRAFLVPISFKSAPQGCLFLDLLSDYAYLDLLPSLTFHCLCFPVACCGRRCTPSSID